MDFFFLFTTIEGFFQIDQMGYKWCLSHIAC